MGRKQYEINDHLGNIRTVVTDRKLFAPASNSYTADNIAVNNYYPFGMLMPERNNNAAGYRFGYQGSEKDDEITSSTGSHYTTHFRELDARVVRWWTIDPKANLMPWESPYLSMGGNPIMYNDPLGDLWGKDSKEKADKARTEINTKIDVLKQEKSDLKEVPNPTINQIA